MRPLPLPGAPDPRPLVRFLETVEAEALVPLAEQSFRVAGGWVLHGGPGSPVSKALGLELGAPPTDADLDALVTSFEERATAAKVELSALAPATLLARLAARGFVLRAVEHVLVHALDALPAAEAPAGVRLGRVDATDGAALRAAIETAMSGFDREDDLSPGALVSFGLAAALRPSGDTFAATAGAELVGAASCDSASGVTALFGASVRPEWRGRGIQRALLAARLSRARERGSTLATIRSHPGEATERNARRLGFVLAYARVVLVRPLPARELSQE